MNAPVLHPLRHHHQQKSITAKEWCIVWFWAVRTNYRVAKRYFNFIKNISCFVSQRQTPLKPRHGTSSTFERVHINVGSF